MTTRNRIKSLRKEFKAPKASFVIATIGFGGWEMAGPHFVLVQSELDTWLLPLRE